MQLKRFLVLILSSPVWATVTVTSTRDYRIATQTTQSGARITNDQANAAAGATRDGGNGSSSASNESSATGQTTAITSCHFHGSTQFCVDGQGREGSVVPAPSNTKDAPSEYTGCHAHETDTFCMNGDDEVQFAAELESSSSSSSSSGGKKNCHFHAGVEHCLAEGESEHGSKLAQSCERVDRDYNIPLRIGLLFVILATSAIGVFGPILLTRFTNFSTDSNVIVIIKQFGTGVIVSTAFVHLITHAELMWGNSCISLQYESTASAITMAGIFLAFLIEYVGTRVVKNSIDKRSAQNSSDHEDQKDINSSEENTVPVHNHNHHFHGSALQDKLSVMLLEAGIVFHSILIGITLVVAGDSFFITLFIVILFHQMFEGLALGSRIAELKDAKLLSKLLMASVFAVITPIGMAIGIGTLKKFNGNDPSTVIALGTLDSFSAGVLIWTGLIEMWAHDWLFGSLANAPMIKTSLAFVALVAGMILMSVLGKWA